MAMILCEPILPMTLHNPELPKGIDSWWHRASARDPAQRFQSAKQLVDSLADVLAIEHKLEIPDLLPLGLRSQGVSSLPPVSLLPAEPDEPSVVVANSGDWWQSASAAGDESKTRGRDGGIRSPNAGFCRRERPRCWLSSRSRRFRRLTRQTSCKRFPRFCVIRRASPFPLRSWSRSDRARRPDSRRILPRRFDAEADACTRGSRREACARSCGGAEA